MSFWQENFADGEGMCSLIKNQKNGSHAQFSYSTSLEELWRTYLLLLHHAFVGIIFFQLQFGSLDLVNFTKNCLFIGQAHASGSSFEFECTVDGRWESDEISPRLADARKQIQHIKRHGTYFIFSSISVMLSRGLLGILLKRVCSSWLSSLILV